MAKLDSLTSLRFFAALWIVIYHARDQFNCLWDLPRNIVFSQGVTFFFVLSGFILAYVYPKLDSQKDIAIYLKRRIGRIWPLHAAVLISIALTLPQSVQLVPVSHQAPYYLLFFTNLFMVQSWFPIDQFFFSFNPPAWSISNEFFFYLMLPLILLGSKPTSKLSILPLVVSFSAVVLMCAFSNSLNLPMVNNEALSLQALIGVNPLVRIFDFCLGVVCAQIFSKCKFEWNQIQATIFEIAALALALWIILNTAPIASSAEHLPNISKAGAYWLRESGLVAIPFALLIYTLAHQKGLLAKILSAPLLVQLGEISFAIYLLHFPLLKWFYQHIPQVRSITDFGLYLTILFCSSYLSYKLWERPWRDYFAHIADKANITPSRYKLAPGILVPLLMIGASIILLQPKTQILNNSENYQLSKLNTFQETALDFGSNLKLDGYAISKTFLARKLSLYWSVKVQLAFDGNQPFLIQFKNKKGDLFHQQQMQLCPGMKSQLASTNALNFLSPLEIPEQVFQETEKMTIQTNQNTKTITLSH
ncbi:MAG: acyltransferase [Candidatus Melainabacteria bacterium]|nr:MAG: acyltransferase [Candidatus Melainabacteria bacterium]